MKYILPKGFLSSGIKSGIKKNKLDCGLIYSIKNCDAVITFTKSKLVSSHIIYDRKISNKPVRAIFVNSGNANTFTGMEGVKDLFKIASKLSARLKIRSNSILFAATRKIGKRLVLDLD